MGKRFGSSIRIVAALFLSLFMTNFAPVMTAHASNGNNGTLKVHEYGTASGTESNDPKVCIFNFEGFSFDASQSGYIMIDGQGQTNGSYGAYDFGPTDANGDAATDYFNDQNGPSIPNGHYKATLYGKDTGGNIDLRDEKAKSKVFKIECAAPNIEVTPTAPTKSDTCGTFNDSYTIPSTTGVVYKVNGNTVSAGTYYPWMIPATSVTITAESTGSPYVLTGTVSWTFDYTNHQCDKVTTHVQDECVDKDHHNGEFSVKTTNKSDEDVYYIVLINNGKKDFHHELVSAHSSYTFEFNGYGPGTFDVEVIKVTSNVLGQFYIPDSFVESMLAGAPMPWLNFKTIHQGTVTLDACPCDDGDDDDDDSQPPVIDVCPNLPGTQTNLADCQTGGNPGQVLGDSTPTAGNILSTSTNVPNVLPDTSGDTSALWLPLTGAVGTFLTIRRYTDKKANK